MKEFAKSFYRSKQWETTREYILKRDAYLCVKCGAPAAEVHHKIHLTHQNINDTAISLNPDNLESLCRSCHQHEHTADRTKSSRVIIPEMEGYTFDENGMIVQKN